MNASLSAEFGDREAERIGPSLYSGDNGLLIHGGANDISNIATFQWQYCKMPAVSNPAIACGMDGIEADTAFIKDLCRWARMAPSRVAKEAKLTPTTILHPYNGRAEWRISQPTFDKLRKRFPEYPGWKNEHPDQAGVVGGLADPDSRLPEVVYIRDVDIRYAMGDGAFVADYPEVGLVPFDLNFIQSLTRSDTEHLFIARGDGDSMMPTLMTGDLVLVDASQRRIAEHDRIWAISYHGAGAIKRVRPLKGGRYEIVSDNKIIEPKAVDAEDLHVIGRVIWVGRRI